MKRLTLIAVLALLSVFLALPISNVVAGEKVWEAGVSGTYSDVDDVGEVASATGEVLAPVAGFLFGPAFNFTYVKPDNGNSITGVGWGGSAEYDFNEGSMVWFARLNALYFTGETDLDWSAALGAGVKFGDQNTFLKVTLQRSRLYGAGAFEADSTDVLLGIGVRL